ncbi:hypothetical protein TNCV_4885791 [Trichonephila clavipes]|uniref:Uncharacterized protein n=1 Tax=Trichonephila clavipes TaxID=2585209 RepID=A0A8X6V1F5_TRICX|nr:hypothetical protein TNCV_4885791 [Trichonephila clavipes]
MTITTSYHGSIKFVRAAVAQWSRDGPQTCVSNMSKNGLKQISQEMMCLTSSQVNWEDTENCVEFWSKEMSDIKVDDNCLFE